MKTRIYSLTSLALAASVSLATVMLSTSVLAQDKVQNQSKDQIGDQYKPQASYRAQAMICGT